MSGFTVQCHFNTIEELTEFVEKLQTARVEAVGADPIPLPSSKSVTPPPKKKSATRKKKAVKKPEVAPSAEHTPDELRGYLLQVVTHKGNQVARELLSRQGVKRLSDLEELKEKWGAFIADCKKVLE